VLQLPGCRSICARIGDRRWESRTLGFLAQLYLELGQLESVEEHLLPAIAASRARGLYLVRGLLESRS
jgi:hypothetical protein